MRDGHVQIIESPPKAEDFKAHLSNFKKRGEIGAVFVDYVQRIRSEHPSTTQRDTVNTASRELVASAVEFGCPFIVGAQFNREASKGEKEEGLHDLKESGNLEEDANTVLSIVNISRAVRDAKKESAASYNGNKDKEEEEKQELLKINVLKSRDGHQRKGFLVFSNRFWRVKDFDEELSGKEERRLADVRDEYDTNRK